MPSPGAAGTTWELNAQPSGKDPVSGMPQRREHREVHTLSSVFIWLRQSVLFLRQSWELRLASYRRRLGVRGACAKSKTSATLGLHMSGSPEAMPGATNGPDGSEWVCVRALAQVPSPALSQKPCGVNLIPRLFL